MGQGLCETDEVIDFVRLRFDEEILFVGRIALKAQSWRDLLAFARFVDAYSVHRKKWRAIANVGEAPNAPVTGCSRLSEHCGANLSQLRPF